MIFRICIATLLDTIFCTACTSNNLSTENKTQIAEVKPVNTTYRLLTDKDSIKQINQYFNSEQLKILFVLNRVDADNITGLDSIVIPENLSGSVIGYSPFPQSAGFLGDIDKIIFFSYNSQDFGAYEKGSLVYSGPTNMGRKADMTPTGLFFTNWKAEETKSTFNDEWELKWNFNIENKEGIGWHQYAMPGYPASHSCLRLNENDAKYLYKWAEQWVVKGTDTIIAKGTPVIVFGAYPFGGSKPWLQLSSNARVLDISTEQLEAETKGYLTEVITEQQKTREQTKKETATK